MAPNRYECEMCEYSTGNSESFIKHNNSEEHLEMLRALHKCPFCDDFFRRPILLTQHLISCDEKLERESRSHAEALVEALSADRKKTEEALREARIAKQRADEAIEELVKLRKILCDAGKPIVMKAGKAFGSE